MKPVRATIFMFHCVFKCRKLCFVAKIADPNEFTRGNTFHLHLASMKVASKKGSIWKMLFPKAVKTEVNMIIAFV